MLVPWAERSAWHKGSLPELAGSISGPAATLSQCLPCGRGPSQRQIQATDQRVARVVLGGPAQPVPKVPLTSWLHDKALGVTLPVIQELFGTS